MPKSRYSSLEGCDGPNARLHDKPLPLHKLLTYPVVLSVSNYVAVAFLHICAGSLLPLFLAMPLDIGGLNLSPSVIGYIIGSYGLVNAVFQGFCFSPIVRRWGERVVVIAATSAFIPIFLMFPVINLLARGWGQSSLGVWFLIGILVVLLTFMEMAFGTLTCLNFHFYLMSLYFARGRFYLHYLFRSQSAFPWSDKWTFSNNRVHCSGYRSCIVHVTFFVLRGEEYSWWFWRLRCPRYILRIRNIPRSSPTSQTLG